MASTALHICFFQPLCSGARKRERARLRQHSERLVLETARNCSGNRPPGPSAFRTTRGARYIHAKCRPRGVTDTSALSVVPSAGARKTETVLGRQFHGCDGGRSIPLKRTTGRVVFDGPFTERAFRWQPAPAIRDGCPPVARCRPIARQSHARSATLRGVQPQQAAPRRANRPVRKRGQEKNDDSGSYWEER